MRCRKSDCFSCKRSDCTNNYIKPLKPRTEEQSAKAAKRREVLKADRDMNIANSVGCTSFNHENKQAIVQMLDPVDFESDLFEYDYEKTLVHELLHLKFSDVDDSGDPLRDKMTHQLIDDLARAFVVAVHNFGLID